MSKIIKSIAVASLCLAVSAAFAKPPSKLISHNKIDYSTRANILVNGSWIPQTPTSAGKDKEVSWMSVQMMCGANPDNCQAQIVVMTNPEIILGVAKLDLKTGTVTPNELKKDGYKVTYLNPGEIEITHDS